MSGLQEAEQVSGGQEKKEKFRVKEYHREDKTSERYLKRRRE